MIVHLTLNLTESNETYQLIIKGSIENERRS